MKLEKFSIAAGIVLILLLAVLIVWQADIVGVSKGGLEKDARKRQNIENGWEVAQAVNEDICAMLFYDTDKADCTYSIYLTREGMSYGYFFGQGGSDAYMTEGVKGVIFENKGIALLSMNHDRVSRIEAGNSEIPVDPEKPFVVVLPIDCGEITIYDAQENIVTLYDSYTGI
jgi:hypothetical protein